MKLRHALSACTAILLVSGASQAQQDIAISTTSPAGLNNVNFDDDALIGYDPATNLAVQLFDLEDAFGVTRDLDAAHILPNGNLVISTQAGATIAGLAYTESDLIELNPTAGTATMFLDASAIGLVGIGGSVPNINAAHVLPNGNVLFSVRNDSTLLGETIDNEDVVEFNPNANTASILFDGSQITGDDDRDLRGFAVLDDGTYMFSAINGGGDGPMTIAGVGFSRDDVVQYDPVAQTASVYLEGLNEFDNPGEIIDSITPAVIPEPASALLLALGGLAVLRRRA